MLLLRPARRSRQAPEATTEQRQATTHEAEAPPKLPELPRSTFERLLPHGANLVLRAPPGGPRESPVWRRVATAQVVLLARVVWPGQFETPAETPRCLVNLFEGTFYRHSLPLQEEASAATARNALPESCRVL